MTTDAPNLAFGITSDSVHRRLDRRNAQHAGRKFDFSIDTHARLCHARFRRVSVLLVERAIADAEPEVGAIRRRDVHVSGSKQRNRLVLPAAQRRIIDVERLDIHGVVGRCVRDGQPVGVTRAVVPMEMDLTAAACVQPLRQNRALISRRDGIFARRKPDIDIRPRQPLGEIRRGSIRKAGDDGTRRLQLASDLREQRSQRLRVVAQQDALTLLHGQRRDDALCERGIRNLLRPGADGDGQRQTDGHAILKGGPANAHIGVLTGEVIA